MEIRTEIISPEFTKHHILGLPFDAALHHFTGIDKGGPHDHPWNFTSHVIKGWYIEKRYNINGQTEVFERLRGSTFFVPAETIHEIIDLPFGGDCYTLVLPHKWKREPMFWKFENGIAYNRLWNETEYKQI